MKNNPIKLRVIFMGTSAFAERILSALIHGKYNITSVYTQPDKKVGRKQTLQKSPTRITAEKNGLLVFTPNRLDASVVSEIKKQKPDIIIVAAYGKILPETVLDLPKFGAINVHASLLPKYRGASPIQNAILNGETETGSTIMLMDKGIDTGDILSQRPVQIEKDEISFELSKKLAEVSAELLRETIPLWIEKKITPQKQDDSKASLCRMISREDGRIDWNDTARHIHNRFRAFQPWPGIFSVWKRHGKILRVKLNKISLPASLCEALQAGLPDKKNEVAKIAGEIIKIGEKIGVATSHGFVILEAVQLEGKPETKIEAFLNGYPDFIGSVLK